MADPKLPKTSLVVAYRSDSGPRERAWQWLEQKWRAMWPGLEICASDDDGGSPFCKSMALNRAIEKSTGEVLVVADADVYVAAQSVYRYAIKVYQRQYQFVSPWNRWLGLNEEDTGAVLASSPSGTLNVTGEMKRRLTPERHDSAPGSLLIIPREAWEQVRGFDERFRGWGGDDSSFFWAVDTLWGRHTRVEGELVHLWHPRGLSKNRREFTWENQDSWTHKPLELKYRAAWRIPRLMKKLVEDPARRLST